LIFTFSLYQYLSPKMGHDWSLFHSTVNQEAGQMLSESLINDSNLNRSVNDLFSPLAIPGHPVCMSLACSYWIGQTVEDRDYWLKRFERWTTNYMNTAPNSEAYQSACAISKREQVKVSAFAVIADYKARLSFTVIVGVLNSKGDYTYFRVDPPRGFDDGTDLRIVNAAVFQLKYPPYPGGIINGFFARVKRFFFPLQEVLHVHRHFPDWNDFSTFVLLGSSSPFSSYTRYSEISQMLTGMPPPQKTQKTQDVSEVIVIDDDNGDNEEKVDLQRKSRSVIQVNNLSDTYESLVQVVDGSMSLHVNEYVTGEELCKALGLPDEEDEIDDFRDDEQGQVASQTDVLTSSFFKDIFKDNPKFSTSSSDSSTAAITSVASSSATLSKVVTASSATLSSAKSTSSAQSTIASTSTSLANKEESLDLIKKLIEINKATESISHEDGQWNTSQGGELLCMNSKGDFFFILISEHIRLVELGKTKLIRGSNSKLLLFILSYAITKRACGRSNLGEKKGRVYWEDCCLTLQSLAASLYPVLFSALFADMNPDELVAIPFIDMVAVFMAAQAATVLVRNSDLWKRVAQFTVGAVSRLHVNAFYTSMREARENVLNNNFPPKKTWLRPFAGASILGDNNFVINGACTHVTNHPSCVSRNQMEDIALSLIVGRVTSSPTTPNDTVLLMSSSGTTSNAASASSASSGRSMVKYDDSIFGTSEVLKGLLRSIVDKLADNVSLSIEMLKQIRAHPLEAAKCIKNTGFSLEVSWLILSFLIKRSSAFAINRLRFEATITKEMAFNGLTHAFNPSHPFADVIITDQRFSISFMFLVKHCVDNERLSAESTTAVVRRETLASFSAHLQGFKIKEQFNFALTLGEEILSIAAITAQETSERLNGVPAQGVIQRNVVIAVLAFLKRRDDGFRNDHIRIADAVGTWAASAEGRKRGAAVTNKLLAAIIKRGGTGKKDGKLGGGIN
jgi:hypothetical protein